jgi:hypothetical protein
MNSREQPEDQIRASFWSVFKRWWPGRSISSLKPLSICVTATVPNW